MGKGAENRISKEVKGRILSATVSQNPSGKYFVALCCTDVEGVALVRRAENDRKIYDSQRGR